MKVLIVGAGISGLTLGAFLGKHAHFEVDIIDKQEDWSRLGYTIGIWDVGRRVLSKLDLDEEFDRLGHQMHTLKIADRSAKHVLKVYHFQDFYDRYESAYTHISRKDLHELLEGACSSKVRMGLSLKAISQHDGGADVTFSDGTTRTYDLVVGADGIRSQVRDMVFGTDRVAYSGNRCWFAWIPKEYVEPQTVVEIIGGKEICNLFDDPTHACMALTAPEKPGTFDDPATRIERLKKHFAGFGYPITEILDKLKPEELMPTDIGFVTSTDWVRDRVILIGDAAHAMEPFGGIGASMGMEDADVLAEELCELHDNATIGKIMNRYVERRLPRIRQAQQQTRLRYRWLTLPIPGLATLRDLCAPLVPIAHFTRGYKNLIDTQA